MALLLLPMASLSSNCPSTPSPELRAALHAMPSRHRISVHRLFSYSTLDDPYGRHGPLKPLARNLQLACKPTLISSWRGQATVSWIHQFDHQALIHPWPSPTRVNSHPLPQAHPRQGSSRFLRLYDCSLFYTSLPNLRFADLNAGVIIICHISSPRTTPTKPRTALFSLILAFYPVSSFRFATFPTPSKRAFPWFHTWSSTLLHWQPPPGGDASLREFKRSLVGQKLGVPAKLF